MILKPLQNIIDVTIKHTGHVHIIGDLHGHFHDLYTILCKFGWPSVDNVYVFDGDFVDRGCWGLETLVVLCVLKVRWPGFVWLVRGNHECSSVMERYGFRKEVGVKYDEGVWRLCMGVVRECPLAVVVRCLRDGEGGGRVGGVGGLGSCSPRRLMRDLEKKEGGGGRRVSKRIRERASRGKGVERSGIWRSGLVVGERRVLVVHGGLFRAWRAGGDGGMGNGGKRGKKGGRGIGEGKFELGTLEDLAAVNRHDDDPHLSLVEDVLWSDPQLEENNIKENVRRGAGILYGPGAVEHFFNRNRLHGLIRGHEGPDMREERPEMGHVDDGWSLDMEFPDGKFVATVFSASEYIEGGKNRAAVATLSGRGVKNGGNGLLPKFTTLEIPDRPQNVELFYDPNGCDRPATPRDDDMMMS